MIQSGAGLVRNIKNSREAGFGVVDAALRVLENAAPHIVFLFSSIRYDQKELIAGAVSALPQNTILVGASAAGEITSSATVFDGATALALSSDQMSCSVGIGSGVRRDSFKAGADAAREAAANAQGPLGLFVMLPDGLNGNGAEIVRGAQSALGENFPIIGGSAGDDYLFKQTWQYHNGEVLTDSVIGIGFSGKFSFGFGVRHGWEPIGLPMKVTKADGAVLKEVDGKPALEIYSEYFGKAATELIREPIARMAYTYPLGMSVDGSDEFLIRDPVIANEKGEITMAAEIPEGATIRLMFGDRDKAIVAAREAASTALLQLEGHTPRAIFMFNCMARNRLLGVHCHEENETVQSVIGKDVPMAGFYTYGEQGPLLGKKGTKAYFHNETMTLMALGE